MDGRMRWRSAVGDHRVVVIADVDLAADRSLEQPGGQVLAAPVHGEATHPRRHLDPRRFELDRGEFGEFRFVHQAGAEPVLGFTERSVGGATGHTFAACSRTSIVGGAPASAARTATGPGDDPAAGILGGAARRAGSAGTTPLRARR